MRFRGKLIVAACIGIAACTAPRPAPTPTPPPIDQPRPTPTPTPPPPVPSTNWMDAAQTPGDWYYRSGGGTTRALFGSANADARFAITCYPARRSITLARAGTANGTVPMRIFTEFRNRSLDAVPSTDGAPSLIATLPASDPILDAMAFSKGRFAVETGNQEPLYLPSWPEVTRVIEDCRR